MTDEVKVEEFDSKELMKLMNKELGVTAERFYKCKYSDIDLLCLCPESGKSFYTLNLITMKPTKNSTIQKDLSKECLNIIKDNYSKI